MPKNNFEGDSDSEEEHSTSGEEASSDSDNSGNEDNSDGSNAGSKSKSGSSDSGSESGSENSSNEEGQSENEKNAANEEGSGSQSENDSNESNKGSEEENDNEEDNDDDDDDDDKADSGLNTSRASSQSKSSSSSSGRSSKNLKEYWEKDPDIYGIRRSNRERKQPERIESERKETKKKRRKSSSQWNSSDESASEDDESDDSDRPTYRKKRPPPRKPSRTYRRSDSDDGGTSKKAKRSARGVGSKVSYKEDTDGEDEDDEEDLVEVDWGSQEKEEENVQTIEKVMTHRTGKKGAVGMQTYIYEVEKNGDPNSDFDLSDAAQVETQFLIKWKGWAHIHNTWESEESLKTQKVKGYKKLENYLRKEEDVQLWRNRATPEEVEYVEIQAELERDLHASHLNAERVFAEAEENDKTYFYLKWQNLPYSEATWELEEMIQKRFPVELEAFREREKSSCYPKQCPVLKHRPKFSPLKLQPDFLGGNNQDLELRDYQMDGLNWLIHSWCKQNSVILADEMGLGKTIQTIAFLSYLFHTHHLYGPFLLVLPLSTLNAWQKEFMQWAPDMNVIVYIGDRDSRRIIHDYEWTFGSKRIKFNAVLTTYEILLRDKEVLQDSCQWAALVIDEAHRLKNEDSLLYQALREFKTNHRLLITGTPLQNSLKELWALLHFIMPEKFDDWPYFESQHETDNMKKGFHKLHKQLEPFLLRRVKKDVEKSLPAKVEQILRVDMTSVQRQYYKWILTKNYDMLKKGNRGSTSSFVNIVMELKKCCNHAHLTKESEDPLTSQTDFTQQLLRGSGKLMLLDKLLVRLNETGHRVLIFSQMVRMLDILAQYLQLRRFPFQRLDGSINGELRRQALEHFNAEGSSDFCFLLSTRAGGLGINLATADTVIIFDSDWNPQNDLQAQARAHRIGQKNQVNIYRLVTKSSIEETIIERAKKKMVLDHLVIQSMDTSGRTVFNKKIASTSATPFNKEELNAILKFGAEELFKDDEENDEEPMCDIDEILRRAETRDEGPSSAGDELLSAFKVASFNIDEEEEVSKLDSIQDDTTRDWDEIIPENIRSQIAEEERKKEMAELYLAPRKRKTVNQDDKENDTPTKKLKKESESSGEEESDDDRPKRRGRPRVYHKEMVKGFTDPEVRRFFKGFKKFSNPLRRLDTIAIDADIREKSVEELHLLGTTIIERCHEAIKEHETQQKDGGDKQPDVNGATAGRKRRDRGPSFKLSGVAINAKTTLSILEELDPLDRVVPHPPVERASWTLQLKRVKDSHWDVPWNIQDDSRLLRGIYEYGMGSWEQVKGDPALNLGDKVLLEGDLKPQAKHLENRVQYLLKMIKKTQGFIAAKQPRAPKPPKVKKFKEPKGISKEIIENDDSTDDEATNASSTVSTTSKKSAKDTTTKEVKKHPKEVKPEVKEENKELEKQKEESKEKPKKKKKEKKERSQGPLHITANGEPLPVDDTVELDQNHPQWPDCKEKMRPMKKALKALDNPNNCMTQEEQIQHTRKCLIQIGDHIEKTLQQYSDHDTHKEWKNLLWQFVSKFTEYDAKKLHKLYKKHKKLIEEKKEGTEVKKEEKEKKEHHHHHHHKKDKDKAKKKEKEKKEKGDESKKHSHKRKHEEEVNQQDKKKPYNGWSADRNRDTSQQRPEKSRERDERDRDRSRDRERSGDRNYQRPWHNTSSNREYSKESRYPQDFKRNSGYHRDGFKAHGGGYHRGPSEWGNRPHHPKHPPSYGPPGGYPPAAHYPPPLMYGMMPGGGGRMAPHQNMPYGGGAPHWGGGKGRNDRHDWGKDSGACGAGPDRVAPKPDWSKKDPRTEARQERSQQPF